MSRMLGRFAVAPALTCFGIRDLSAQATPFGGLVPTNEEPLQMVSDYGVGPAKHRESRRGVFEPIRLVVDQSVGITLGFLRRRAGDAVGGTEQYQISLRVPDAMESPPGVAVTFECKNLKENS